MLTTQQEEITESIYYFEDWNNGLGKKYLVTRESSIPVMDDGRVSGYSNAPEKFTEVPRCNSRSE